MKILPRNLLLLLLLAALVAANIWLERVPRESATTERLFPAFDPARVAVVEIIAEIVVPGEGEAASLRFARHDEGWRLSEAGGFPVLAPRVDSLVKRVATLGTADRVGESRASHPSFGVGDSGRRLRFLDDAGVPLAALVQGAGPEGGAGCYLRAETGDAVYRAATLPLVDTNPMVWIDTRLVVLDPARINGVHGRLEEEGIDFDLTLTENGRWQSADPVAAPLASAAVGPLLAVASRLYFAALDSRLPGPESGLDPPALQLEFRLDDGTAVEAWIGAPVESDLRLATNPGWDGAWCVRLPETSFSRLRTMMRRIAAALQ